MRKRPTGDASLYFFDSLFVEEAVALGEPLDDLADLTSSESAVEPLPEPQPGPLPELFDFATLPGVRQHNPSFGSELETAKLSPSSRSAPPDAAERRRALDPAQSFLVQAPAGSGKTHLLTQRFLKLLSEAGKPEEILAITFTNAAAAEMRNRILFVLEQAQAQLNAPGFPGKERTTDSDPDSLESLSHKALARARLLDWQLLDQPAQLRITTIDAYCRSLALQCPLNWGQLSGLGGRLDPVKNPIDLYRRAASQMMDRLLREDAPHDASARRAIEALLLWRDNNWQDVQELIVDMLGSRNRWYREFVFTREPNWEGLRKRLEAPMRRASRKTLKKLNRKLDNLPGMREEALELCRVACRTPGKLSPLALAERAEFPTLPAPGADEEDAHLLADAAKAYSDLARFLIKSDGGWRSAERINKHHGFPATDIGRVQKEKFGLFVAELAKEPGLLDALAACNTPLPTGYTEQDWELIRNCFAVLRTAAIELQLIFAQSGSVDFTEVSQIALRVLAPENGFPSDFAIHQADGIHHLLVDEFQDTSRNQHQLLSRLIAAWPDREGRSCFCVGDPVQSIYGFRDAEVELFERLKTHGLEMESETGSGDAPVPFRFEFLSLRANFRTVPSLVEDLNIHFKSMFAGEHESGVSFSSAVAARPAPALYHAGQNVGFLKSSPESSPSKTELHLAFTLKKAISGQPLSTSNDSSGGGNAAQLGDPARTRAEQLAEIVELVRKKLTVGNLELADKPGSIPEKYRIAILARTKKSLILIADALRKAKINYRAIELVPLGQRPEVLDALALTRALLNPADRTAWLAVLRAPWCGLSLDELHRLTSADDREVAGMAVPDLLHTNLRKTSPGKESRLDSLYAEGLLNARAFHAVARVRGVFEWASATRASSSSLALGTWLESVWKALGAADTVNPEELANVQLLWAAIDKLQQGEVDLLGPALPGMLKDLCALPDPAASSTFGVQLMTIHKSKGLEFEVVIVPDLEADGSKDKKNLVSWLERGLSEPDSQEITEFLIGPIQSKGDDAGPAKAWVDRVKCQREAQELKRLLYVAATRAREELHLFARPRFSLRQGIPVLDRSSGLLAIAWGAFSGEVEARFANWLELFDPAESRVALAAGAAETAEANLLVLPSPALERRRATRPNLLRRLPENYNPPSPMSSMIENLTGPGVATAALLNQRQDSIESIQNKSERSTLFARTEGGLEARLEGIAIHAFLEQLSLLRQTPGALGEPAAAARRLADFLPAITARLRGHGLSLDTARKLAGDALAVSRRSSIDPVGAWIFAPHPKSQSEAAWTGIFDGKQQNVRADRVFFAPIPTFLEPNPFESPGRAGDTQSPVWWVIDYKTTHGSGPNLARPDFSSPSNREAFLRLERQQFSAQLSIYALALRKLTAGKIQPDPTQSISESGRNGCQSIPVYAGIYYPRLRLFDFWEV